MQPLATALHHAPRAIDVLRYDGLVFILAEKLATDVSFDDLFIIRCEALDLTVWGQTLTEAEEALAFGFYSLYQNYYLADDDQLTADAQQLKAQLHTLILDTVQL
jgi:hypothetical protein